MEKTILHPKIQALRLRNSSPIAYFDQPGVDLKIRAEGNDRIVKGYLAVFGVKDSYGTVAVKGAFRRSIEERGPNSNAKNKIVMLWMHRPDEPIGRFLVLREDDYGLYFEAEMDDVPQGERALRQIRSGTLNQYSYGFRYVWDKMEYKESEDAIFMYDTMMFEGSVLAIQASNPETYTVRSEEELQLDAMELEAETEEFIRTIPRRQQLELRQLIAKHISLSKVTTEKLEQRTQGHVERDNGLLVIGDYKIDTKQFI